MSNQDQYGQKGQSNQYGDDFDSLTEDQKIQRKEQHAQQQGDQSQGQGGASTYGDDFDSLSDEDKIARKNQTAQQQGDQTQGQQQNQQPTGQGQDYGSKS